MANITTISGMRDYIKRELGAPVINVELDDTQLDQIIDDTVDFFNEENYGEGAFRTYIAFSATNGIDEYSLSGNDLTSVFDFVFDSSSNSINTLFSPMNTLLYSDWVLKGNYPGAGGNCQGQTLSYYQIQMNELNNVKEMFERKYRVDFRPNTQTLKITPTPNEDMIGILLCYKKSELTTVLNNRYVKALAVGKAKKLWGFIIGKFQMTLPGGGTMNGDAIKEEGKAEIEEAILNIRLTSEPIDFYLE